MSTTPHPIRPPRPLGDVVALDVHLFPYRERISATSADEWTHGLADRTERNALGDRTLAVGTLLSCALDAAAIGDDHLVVLFVRAATLIIRAVDTTRDDCQVAP